MKTFLKLSAFALLVTSCVAGLWSCEKTYERPGSSVVNAAVKITVNGITPAQANVSLISEQDNIKSLMFVTAKKSPSEVDYLSMDAVGRLAYIKEHGTQVDHPYVNTMKNLDPETTYAVAAFGLDKDGVVRTAPYFTTFKTATAIAVATCNYVGEFDGKFRFSYSITPNEYVKEYKYIVSNDASIVKLSEDKLKELIIAGGKDVQTATEAIKVDKFDMDVKKDLIVATLSYDESGRACSFSSEIAGVKSKVYFLYNGQKVEMQRVNEEEDIFEGTYEVTKDATFTFDINKDEYGFTSFSGNGGVGQITSEVAAMPWYYVKGKPTEKYHEKYFFVSESIGRLSTVKDGGNPLWVAEANDGKIFVRINLIAGDNIPRYYVKWVEDTPNVVLKQNFDLCSYGAYYMIKYNATNSTAYPQGTVKFSTNPGFDGTIAGEKNGCNGTALATAAAFYPVALKDGAEVATDLFMSNKGLLGWEFSYFGELAGALAIGNGTNKGRATTPFLTALTSPTNITVEYETVGYGNNSDDFALILTGAGKFTACEASNSDGTKTIAVTSDQKIVIPNGTIKQFTPSGDPDKEYTHIKASVTGADATTRVTFAFDESATSDNKSRSVLDNILITK